MTVNAARAVGPAIGGVLIATVGIGVCFLLNAASFAAVVTSLLIMDRPALRPSPPSGRASGQLREGLRYAARTPTIAIPLAMMGLVGLFAYEFSVSLPVLAERSFHGGVKPMRATSKRPSLACFIAFLPAYAATNRVRLRDATMLESADAPASVARQSRYA